jgi:two-component system, LytTR family, response regulator
MKLKVIIVDDEEASRDTLQNYLQKYCPDVTLVGTASSAKQGAELIQAHTPDVVFLDVEMPYGNAFDLLEAVGDISFETVFVTAFSNYALKALNLSAAYYILKPIEIDELILAVEKIKKQNEGKQKILHTKILVENIQAENKQAQKIVLPLLEGFEVVQVKDIIRCEANDNFTNFILTDHRKIMICRTLKQYESMLEDYNFVRVHKSHLINIQHVSKYLKGKGGQLVMSDQSCVDVSPNKKEELMKRFIG